MPMTLEGSTILIADDEGPIRDLLQDILAPQGARVIIATSGTEAIAILESEAPDLAILDVRMPEPGGVGDFAAFARAGERHSRVDHYRV